MKRVLLSFVVVVCVYSCSGSSSSPATPTATSTTRIIGLIGSLAFGNVAIGQEATATLTITNTGNARLTVTGMTGPSAYTASWTSGSIAAGGSQSVTLFFDPIAATTYN